MKYETPMMDIFEVKNVDIVTASDVIDWTTGGDDTPWKPKSDF